LTISGLMPRASASCRTPSSHSANEGRASEAAGAAGAWATSVAPSHNDAIRAARIRTGKSYRVIEANGRMN
jgi:hypothetical protein